MAAVLLVLAPVPDHSVADEEVEHLSVLVLAPDPLAAVVAAIALLLLVVALPLLAVAGAVGLPSLVVAVVEDLPSLVVAVATVLVALVEVAVHLAPAVELLPSEVYQKKFDFYFNFCNDFRLYKAMLAEPLVDEMTHRILAQVVTLLVVVLDPEDKAKFPNDVNSPVSNIF